VESNNLLDRNRELFKEMKELAVKQEKLISEDQIGNFLSLSNRREGLRHEISRNNNRYARLGKKVTGKGGKKEKDALSRDIADVIRSIQEVDQRIEKFILEKREDLLNEVKKMRKGRKALKSYGRKSKTSPRFITRKG